MLFQLISLSLSQQFSTGPEQTLPIKPSRTEVIAPIRNETFNKKGTAKERKQGGNPRNMDGFLVFDGSMDGNRQVDPQIAVGGGYVLHGTNSGFIVYDKGGKFVQGVPQAEFNSGIDPKLFFDSNNRVFGFDVWNPWDKEKKKPVNISVSETSDPTGAWNTYPVPAPNGVDGGGIGYSKTWVGYSFPGGTEQTFVMKMTDLMSGKPAKVYHFPGSLGQPVATQDKTDELYFLKLTDQQIIISQVTASPDGTPVVASIVKKPHRIKYFGFPPNSPMKGVTAQTASGDRNPKNVVLQNGRLWFSQAVNVQGRSGVQWHEVDLDGKFAQSGLIADDKNSYIETTIGVNATGDAVIGFQETGPDMFISARFAYRFSSDPPGKVREIIKFGEGVAATEGGAWGDYSCTVIDGDNLRDIWTVQSVANAKGRGNCAIARIQVDAKLRNRKFWSPAN